MMKKRFRALWSTGRIRLSVSLWGMLLILSLGQVLASGQALGKGQAQGPSRDPDVGHDSFARGRLEPSAPAPEPDPDHYGAGTPGQFILVNGVEPTREAFQQVDSVFQHRSRGNIQVGVGCIISYFQAPCEKVRERLDRYLNLSRTFDLPLVIQLDGEQWWGARPDLWNWWDPGGPGYQPENRMNVEWTGWTSDSAVRIGWRNWGRQLRVQPMPNLMSPRYRAACREAMGELVPRILAWWHQLPADRQYLFVGIKVGWESAIGVNNWYYPGGNQLLGRSASTDPTYGLTPDSLPARGVEAIGYAAVKTLGLADSGTLTAAELTKVVQTHLADLSRFCARLGVPRGRLFTHGGGWAPGESLYTAAVNPYSCPGWSFYDHASDPRGDTTAMSALGSSDAPWWGAVEWLYPGKTEAGWESALRKTLSIPRIRYLCIFNWSGIRGNQAAVGAIRTLVQAGD